VNGDQKDHERRPGQVLGSARFDSRASARRIVYREEKVAKEGGDEEVVAEDAVEKLRGKNVPRNCVRDGREDPVELAFHGGTIGNGAYRYKRWGVRQSDDKASKVESDAINALNMFLKGENTGAATDK
jgi:hypothetical protein